MCYEHQCQRYGKQQYLALGGAGIMSMLHRGHDRHALSRILLMDFSHVFFPDQHGTLADVQQSGDVFFLNDMPSLKKLPNVQMVAFCDIIPERAEKAKAQYGTADAKCYTDYKELLNEKTATMDFVYNEKALEKYSLDKLIGLLNSNS